MTTAPAIDLAHISALYRTHRDDLARVRAQTRTHPAPHLNDIEAEITYLLLRAHTPAHTVQIGTGHGHATTWILSALHDNGTGHLHSFDTRDHTPPTVPTHLADQRWTLIRGDIRTHTHHLPPHIDHLLMDTAHEPWLTRWTLRELLPTLPAHTPVNVHGVFPRAHTPPFTPGALVLTWLTNHTTGFFTASAARAPHTHRALLDLKTELGLADPLHPGHRNPTIYFRLPPRPHRPAPHTNTHASA
ncbi:MULTISPECIES: class I SAM-dependent methyltransferase [unclassified Nocardiopsis]|uniref:class I SAM-dependent methyltransferase n=1 Tax=unclassified Nocardiopsis TaxID=2649073 RepID=UPI00135B77F4|nr:MULTISPECIES: class I SAM-dependent methyltransferase [unclassified Nocardiopsis]